MREIRFIVDEYQYQQMRAVCSRRNVSLRSLILMVISNMDYEDQKKEEKNARRKARRK